MDSVFLDYIVNGLSNLLVNQLIYLEVDFTHRCYWQVIVIILRGDTLTLLLGECGNF